MATPKKYLVLDGTDAPVWPHTDLLASRGDMVPATDAQVNAWHNKVPFGEPEREPDGQPDTLVDILSVTDKEELRAIAKMRGVTLPANASLKVMQDALKG